MAGLKVDYQLLDSIERSLSSLLSEFQNIQTQTGAAQEHAHAKASVASPAGRDRPR